MNVHFLPNVTLRMFTTNPTIQRAEHHGGDRMDSPPSLSSESVTPRNHNHSGDGDDASGSWLSSPKDCVFPETIPEEASSLEEERVVIFRLPTTSTLYDPPFYTVSALAMDDILVGMYSMLFDLSHQSQADASLLRQQTGAVSARPEQRSHFTFDTAGSAVLAEHDPLAAASTAAAAAAQPKLSSSTERDSNNGSYQRSAFDDGGVGGGRDDDASGSGGGGQGSLATGKVDVLAATFLDVAVLRCMFVENWQEDGVYWCLHYMYNR